MSNNDNEDASVPGPVAVVTRTGRAMAIGPDWWEIRDDGTPPQFVEVLTECRQHAGVVYLAFGSMIRDANNDGIVNIASRLRMDLVAAQSLRNMLSGIIDEALKPTDKSTAN